MPKARINKRNSLIEPSLPITKATLLTILILIFVVIAGGLLIGGFFSSGGNQSNSAPLGNQDARAAP